jgi:ribosomal protein S27AE
MRCRRLLRRKMSAGERTSNQNLLLVLTVFEYVGLIRITRWEVIMPQPRKFRLAKPPIGQRRCPACGLPMFLVRIEPTDDAGEDERTFECGKCAYAETVIVKFR